MLAYINLVKYAAVKLFALIQKGEEETEELPRLTTI